MIAYTKFAAFTCLWVIACMTITAMPSWVAYVGALIGGFWFAPWESSDV